MSAKAFEERYERVRNARVYLLVDNGDLRTYLVHASKGQPHEVTAALSDTGYVAVKCDCEAAKFRNEPQVCVHCHRLDTAIKNGEIIPYKSRHTMDFDPRKSMIKVQGGRQYFPAAARIQWFRQDHPLGEITTEVVTINVEKQFAIFRATVRTAEGATLGQGTKFEDVKGFSDYIEKSEKGAIARALGVAGYGTDDAIGYDGEIDRPADAPVGGGQDVSAQEQAKLLRELNKDCSECLKQMGKDEQAKWQAWIKKKFAKPFTKLDVAELAELKAKMADDDPFGDDTKEPEAALASES